MNLPKSRIHVRLCTTSLLPFTSNLNNSAKHFSFNAVITIQGVSIVGWLHCFLGLRFIHWIQYYRHWLFVMFSYRVASNIQFLTSKTLLNPLLYSMTHEVHSFTHTCIFMNLGGTLAENFSFTVLIIIALSGKPQTSYLNSKFFLYGSHLK